MSLEEIYCYSPDGFEFPVVVDRVHVYAENGMRIPLIDSNALRSAVLRTLAFRQSPLTGKHVRFIRHFRGETLSEFGNAFGVKHSAVKKWEDAGDTPTRMNINTERIIRLFALISLPHIPSDIERVCGWTPRELMEEPVIVFGDGVSLLSSWSTEESSTLECFNKEFSRNSENFNVLADAA